MAYVMGINLGSSNIMAVVYDERGKRVSSGSQPTPLTYSKDHPTWSVWDPKRIWDCVVYAVMDATQQMKDPEEIRAVAVTGFGMDGLPVNRDGVPLYPLISWHCPRTIPQFDEIQRTVGAENLFSRTGKQPQSIDTIYRILWIKENYPEILAETDKWLLIEDYINFMLCGTRATDYSLAACTSAFDQRTHDWCGDLLKETGIPRSIFPKAYQSGRVLGTILPIVAQETGLSPKTQVVLGGHDYMCAAFSTGAIDQTSLLDITGVWEMLVIANDKVRLTEDLYESGFYLEGHVVPGKCCYVGSTVSGDMTDWMRRNLCAEEKVIAGAQDIRVWDAISQSCEKSTVGSRGCMFLPHFSGAGSPIHDPNSMGAFLGLHNAVTKRDMLRSVIEGLDYQFRLMMETFAKYNLGKPDRIVATGGAVRNTFWMQNKADVTGCHLEVPDLYEPTPLGAAMIAGLGVGIYSSPREAVEAVKSNVQIYEPNIENHKKYDDYYHNIFVKLQSTLKDVNKELSDRFR